MFKNWPDVLLCTEELVQIFKKLVNKAALFMVAKTWKQPTCLSTQQWIKEMSHIYSGILLSHEKSEVMPFTATWMELEIVTLNEIN